MLTLPKTDDEKGGKMKYFLSVIAGLTVVLLLINPKAASEAIGVSAESCLEVIVPSLFAFTVLAIYLQKSGLYRTALKPLTFPLSKLLRMDEELCAVFVLSNIGGYPVGAKLLTELVRQGRLSPKDAGRMLCFCFGSGPGFMIGIVGMIIFGNAAAGLVLFGACFASSLLIAAYVRTRGEIVLQKSENDCFLTSETFIASVISAARVMFTVCAMIVGFSAISAILKEIGVYAVFESVFGSSEVFPALLEVTRVKDITPTAYALPTCAALLGFGGVCVLMQIAALAKEIPLKGFLISRVPAAFLSVILAAPFAKHFRPEDIQTIASDTTVIPFTKNAPLSVCVLAMCGILLIDIMRGRKRG